MYGPVRMRSAFNRRGRPEPKPRVVFRTVDDLYVYLATEKVLYTRAKLANKRLNKVRACFGLSKSKQTIKSREGCRPIFKLRFIISKRHGHRGLILHLECGVLRRDLACIIHRKISVVER
ncbi:hypothetical protein CEXT_168401 [Caerostris extrusa]|uniref:Transposase n=1 Tax=Caerostris extrusa TaxID=172846 RepID=A0AAV4Y2A1_CAEEX|nr:hypothetical protein CEXT_168401 [Caerostris extrusa]